ncbi:hypothetical protein MKY09_11285 [Psychrobacillus sp. FSL K6-4046]
MGKPDEEKKSKIDTDDAFNRALYGSPTIGGMLVVGIIVVVIIVNIFKS